MKVILYTERQISREAKGAQQSQRWRNREVEFAGMGQVTTLF